MRMSYQKIAVTFIPVFLPFHFLLLLKTVAASKCCYWKKYKERRWKDEKNCIYIHSAYYSSIINHYTHYRKKRPKQLIKLPLKKNFHSLSLSFSFCVLFFVLFYLLLLPAFFIIFYFPHNIYGCFGWGYSIFCSILLNFFLLFRDIKNVCCK